MEDNEPVMGLLRVWVIDQRGYIQEETEYTCMIRDTEGFIRDTNGEASGWYILVGTEDHIMYRGTVETGRVRVLDQGYPEVGATGEKRRMVYRATFAAHTLNARKINGAVLVHRTAEPAQGVAYARINPVIRIGIDDLLRIQWECQALKETDKCLDR
jgi:hypothetical protein